MAEKKKLVEYTLVKPSEYTRKPLSESESPTLKINEDSVKCEAVYTFPISRPNQENLNGRVYSSKLWEKVISEGQASNSYGLVDHPQEEGSMKDRWCVWKNVRFNEDRSLVLADAYLFGNWGREMKESLDAGGEVGLSSVGYGDFKEDGKTVDENIYELDRVADAVLEPSYQVFGRKEDEKESESVEDDTDKLSESEDETTSKKEDTPMAQNETKAAQKAKSLEEKNFRMNIENQVKAIQEIAEPYKRVDAYTELLSFFEEMDFADDLEERVVNLRSQDEQKVQELANKGTEYDKLNEEYETHKETSQQTYDQLEMLKSQLEAITERYESATELLDSLREYSSKVEELYEAQKAKNNTMIKPKEYKELQVYTEDLEIQLANLKDELKQQRRENKKLESKMKRTKNRRNEALVVNHRQNEEEDDDDLQDEEVESQVDESVDQEDESLEEDINYDNVQQDVLDYYEELEASNPNVKDIKKDILNQRTVFEAQRTFMRLSALVEDDAFTSKKKSKYSQQVQKEESNQGLKGPKKAFIRDGWV